jgi:hypothetical protein
LNLHLLFLPATILRRTRLHYKYEGAVVRLITNKTGKSKVFCLAICTADLALQILFLIFWLDDNLLGRRPAGKTIHLARFGVSARGMTICNAHFRGRTAPLLSCESKKGGRLFLCLVTAAFRR